MNPYPSSHLHKLEQVDIVKAIVLTFLTLGIYYFFWQRQQFNQLNILLGRSENKFLKWLFLGIITLGIYHLYHEYLMSKQILEIQSRYGLKVSPEMFPLLCLLISLFGFFIIIDFVHQEELNKIIAHLQHEPKMDALVS